MKLDGYKRFANKEKTVILVDFNHLLQRFYRAMGSLGLSVTVTVDGSPRTINTGPTTGLLNYFVKLSDWGRNPIVVVRDRPVKCRKAYFKRMLENGSISSDKGDYKGNREPYNVDMFEVGDMVCTMLKKAGVLVLGEDNYEADDLFPEVIRVSKKKYPNYPIAILANDFDLTPLVDDQVSLYRYGSKMTFSFDGFMEIDKYAQITPENYQSSLENSTASNKVNTPYNSLVLNKCIRGDSSDNIGILPSFKRKPAKYNQLLEDLVSAGCDLSIFGYHPWRKSYYCLIDEKVYDKLPKGYNPLEWKLKFDEPAEIETMRYYLNLVGLPKDEVDEIIARYHGINLNGAFLDLPENIRRKPFKLKDSVTIESLDFRVLKNEALVLAINLNEF